MTKSNPMVEFFERLGHKVIESNGAWWCEIQPKVLLALPFYKLIEPSEPEIDELMKKYKLRAMRYPAPLSAYGFVSSITVNTDKNYDMPSLHQKARNQTRRGLENCEVERLDFDWLIDNGLPLNISTAQRQRRESHYADPAYWRKYCRAAKAVDGVSAWGAFIEGNLAAFLISVAAEGNWQEWVVNHSLTELRNKYANNALSFTVARHFLRDERSEGICYGLGSLEETGKLDHFKKRMGWTVKPVKQRLVFSRSLSMISALTQGPIPALIGKMFPQSYTVRKASAMLRLYRNQIRGIPDSEDV
ncbi:MAG: hypothetical protein DRP66_00135 [Planctomycetota bacterium]|nr:MAG: hypothetical protein DRP66_00135 [Planctomycetota bacterium]